MPWCLQKQAHAFARSGDFPDEYIYTGADYTTSRGLAARYTFPPIAGVVVPEPWTLAFSRLRVAPPVQILIHNPIVPQGMQVAVAGGLIEANIY